jgi:hypothetical protein
MPEREGRDSGKGICKLPAVADGEIRNYGRGFSILYSSFSMPSCVRWKWEMGDGEGRRIIKRLIIRTLTLRQLQRQSVRNVGNITDDGWRTIAQAICSQ